MRTLIDYFSQGLKYQKEGQYDDAVASYDKALEINPGDSATWNNRGIALRKLGRYDDAVASYDKALKIKPDYATAWNNRGIALDNLGKYDDAVASYDKALTIKLDDSATWYNRGNSLRHLGQYDDAVASYDKALTIKPDYATAWNNRGIALDNLGRYDDAVASYDKALTIKLDDSATWYNRGSSLDNLGKYDDAVASYDKALKIKPDYATAWNNRGSSLDNLGKYDDAVASYDKALEINPGDSDAWNNRSIALENLDRSKMAIGSYDKIIGISEDTEPAFGQYEDGGDLDYLGMYYDALALHAKALDSSKDAEPACGQHVHTRWNSPAWNQDMWDTEPACEQLNNAISKIEGIRKRIEQNIRDQAVKVEQESVSPATKQGIVAIMKTLQQHDIPGALELFRDLAGQQLTQVNAALTTLRTGGAVVEVSSESITQYIAAQRYGDAIIDSEKAITRLTRIQESYEKAKVLIPTITEPAIIALFKDGQYEECIHAIEEQQQFTRKFAEIKENGRKLLVEAEQIGIVPEDVRSQLDSQDIPTIQHAITELEAFRITAIPELTLSLDRTQLSSERWHKLGINLANTGSAHVENVAFAFSNEFETKGIKPFSVKAGQSSHTDISIISKHVGNILLEITLTYKDFKDREYTKVQEFWIDVVEKGMTVTSGTPSSPVSQFTPGSVTQKQFPPELSDRYTGSEFIGKGGFARVFKAKRKDGKYVAVKIPIFMDAITGKSFIAEMQNWTKLSHPNIVKLHDFNIMPMPYFEEELCDSALSDQNKPIENGEAAWVLFNICEGLKFSHGQKIIHRDLKPQNILLKNGVPKISDWGLSRVLSESISATATSFTPFYAAPEQINNRVKDERTDIWQLGVILYELVTDVLPFKGESMVEIGMKIATKDPKRPGEIISGAGVIDAVVMKCLQKEPAKRYQSVLELQKDLAMYLRKNYADQLSTSVSAHDYSQSAYYCGDLVMINMKTGDIATAYKFLLDLVHYSKGNVKTEAQELSEQLKMRMEIGVTEIPIELVQKADLIVHQVSRGFRKRG